MVRFIFFCMAFIAISFFAVPLYFGISKARNQLSERTSFASVNETLAGNPSLLNEIEPAAGKITDEDFSSGFSGDEDSALADDIPAEEQPPL